MVGGHSVHEDGARSTRPHGCFSPVSSCIHGRLAYGNNLLTPFLRLWVILSDAEPDRQPTLAAIKSELSAEWNRQQEQEESLSDEVRSMITQALEFLTGAVDHVVAANTDADEFIDIVFQCRDRITALDLMLRAQAEPACSR
jgi:hypothetical protein